MGKISKLVVDESCRKCGVGQALIDKMEHYLKSVNCEYINIDVFGYNANALSFYDKNGYNIRMHNLIKKI